MPPDLKDIMVLTSRLRYLEEWVALLEHSPLSAAERRERAQERGLVDDIAALRGELMEEWTRLLSGDEVRSTDSDEIRRRRADVDAGLVQLGLMRRLLAVEERLAHACGESLPREPADVSAGLNALTTDPARALPILARAENSPDVDKQIRRAMGVDQVPLRSRVSPLILIGLVLVLFVCGAWALMRISWANTFIARRGVTGTVIGVTRTVAPTALFVAATTEPRTSVPTDLLTVVQTASFTAESTAAPTIEPTLEPPTVESTAAPTIEPTLELPTAAPQSTEIPTLPPTAIPPPTNTPAPRPTPRPAPPPPRVRSFSAEVQASFPGTGASDQQRSCVNGQVIDRSGRGVVGAVLRVNNGVSQSEQKPTNSEGFFEFCGLGASRWSVVLGYVPEPRLAAEVVAVIEVNGQEGQFARVVFRER